MYGRSVKSIWAEKYGEEEANKMWKESIRKREETRRLKKKHKQSPESDYKKIS